jgi:hypothetical protein
MTKHSHSIILSASIAVLLSMPIPLALAKQPCSGAMPPSSHGYWSWRLIDGRKCWYEGKPMLSKSELEWPRQPSAQPDSDGELASAATERPNSPMDSQAKAPPDTDSFNALWRARVERR